MASKKKPAAKATYPHALPQKNFYVIIELLSNDPIVCIENAQNDENAARQAVNNNVEDCEIDDVAGIVVHPVDTGAQFNAVRHGWELVRRKR